jgi:hypothetical protein
MKEEDREEKENDEEEDAEEPVIWSVEALPDFRVMSRHIFQSVSCGLLISERQQMKHKVHK